ncbi:MAG: hypothetical protein WCK15_08340 [Pirellula sp.]
MNAVLGPELGSEIFTWQGDDGPEDDGPEDDGPEDDGPENVEAREVGPSRTKSHKSE